MSYVTSQLQPGEQVLHRITKGRQWYHYVLAILMMCICAPSIGGLWIRFNPFATFPAPGPNDPAWTMLIWATIFYGCMFGFPLLLLYAGLMDFLNIFLVEVALTNKRLLGRVSGAFSLPRRVDIPLEDIESIIVPKHARYALQIKRKSATRPQRLVGLANPQGLVDQYRVLVGH
jgi:hypothetical protein